MEYASNSLQVRVTPRAKRERVEEGKKGVLEVSVKESAAGNRANLRVREIVAQRFGVRVKDVRITAGHVRPRKTFAIRVI